jgi:hypothetical protein
MEVELGSQRPPPSPPPSLERLRDFIREEHQRAVERYRMDTPSPIREIHHHHHQGPPPGPAPAPIVVQSPLVPELLQSHRTMVEGMREAAAAFRETQNAAMRAEQERIALAVAQEQQQRQRHEEVLGLMSTLRNAGLGVSQQFVSHYNAFNNRMLVQQVFTNDPQHLGIPTPSAPDLEMPASPPKRPGDDDPPGMGKRIKAAALATMQALTDRPADLLANEAAKHVVTLANAASAAAAAEQPTPEQAAAMSVGLNAYGPGYKPPVRLSAKELAPYTRAHSEIAARAAKEMVARGAELIAKTTPGRSKPPAEPQAEIVAKADQSGGKPLPKAKFVDKVKASRKAAKPTPSKATPARRAVENLLLEKAKEAKLEAKPVPAKPRGVISSIGKKTPRTAKVKVT